MTKIPPVLPAETLRRVIRVARFDGISVLAIAGLFALVCAAAGDFKSALIGLVIAGAGVFELHGVTLLKTGHKNGVNWLVGSQLYLLTAILSYVLWRLMSYDPGFVRQIFNDQMGQPEMQEKLEESGVTADEMIKTVYYLTYVIFGGVTFFYQGAMALYYQRRRGALTAAAENLAAIK